jgi:uncharacterized YceG family protein
VTDRTPEERAAAAAERARQRAGVTDEPPMATPEEPLWTQQPREPRPAPPRREPPGKRQAPPLRGGRGGRDRVRDRQITPASRGPSRIGRRLVAGIVVLVVALAVVFALKVFQPFHGDGEGVVRVKVPAGASVGDIGKLLESRAVIASSTYFSFNATLTGRRGGLKPGTYTLARDMRYGTVLDALTKGPQTNVIKTFKLTLPEGLSAKEIARRVKDDVDGDYVKAAGSATALKRAHALGLPRAAKTAEGFLFPATYDMPKGGSAENLVEQQLRAFRANFAQVDLRRAKRKNLTRYDVVTIASMVEREVRLDRERPLVAAVIYNRLKQGMVLGIDATTRYEYDNWTDPLTSEQLDAITPYNTRRSRGLPPTPIGNPGLASLEAAAHPAKVGYLYYVVKPGTCGHSFTASAAQSEADVAAYNAARESAGGKSPTPSNC